jgi:squalene-hopene/tetraprenyl-beta-curcumene cyclase
MSPFTWRTSALALAAAILLACWGISTISAGDRQAGADMRLWNQVVDHALAYLKTAQASDGSWSRDKSPGITGVVLAGVLSTDKIGPDDPMAARALGYIESLVNEKAGHIAGKDPKVQLQNYVTSVNVLALVLANRENRYQKVIGDAAQFLKRLQWDEEEGRGPSDSYFGGAGYDSQSRPDLSNTQLFLDALHAAKIAEDDPAYRKALVFVSRCQNLKGEQNDQPWAGKVNDGSFIYSAAAGGQTKTEKLADGALPGYGSMTYAGIKSMIYCGVSKDDPRVQKAYEWITKHYSVDMNPGMPPEHSQWGLFYYYHTMAKCLDVLGVDEVIDANGVHHNWRSDITAALAKRQRPDGSWLNENHWLEADPPLITGYALMALSRCKPKP